MNEDYLQKINLATGIETMIWESPKEREIKILRKKIERLECDLNESKKKVSLPERYIINNGATILFWKDGTKTIVKRCKDDEFNPRLAFLTAFFQRYCGMSKNKANKFLANLEIEKRPEDKEHWQWTDKMFEPMKLKLKRGRPRKLKMGDRVVHKDFGRGKIIYIDNIELSVLPYLVEFDKSQEKFHSGNFSKIKGKENHCWWCSKQEIIREDD